MVVQLLTTEEFVKGLLTIDENIGGAYINTAIMEAQEIGLKSIIGTSLLEALKTRASAGTLTGDYLTLSDKIQFYLGYKACAELLPKVSYKITNMGAVKTSDEKVTNLSKSEVDSLVEYYISKADYCALELQKWLRSNSSSFSELTENDRSQINANLRSMASCGIWLGGARGRR